MWAVNIMGIFGGNLCKEYRIAPRCRRLAGRGRTIGCFSLHQRMAVRNHFHASWAMPGRRWLRPRRYGRICAASPAALATAIEVAMASQVRATRDRAYWYADLQQGDQAPMPRSFDLWPARSLRVAHAPRAPAQDDPSMPSSGPRGNAGSAPTPRGLPWRRRGVLRC